MQGVASGTRWLQGVTAGFLIDEVKGNTMPGVIQEGHDENNRLQR